DLVIASIGSEPRQTLCRSCVDRQRGGRRAREKTGVPSVGSVGAAIRQKLRLSRRFLMYRLSLIEQIHRLPAVHAKLQIRKRPRSRAATRSHVERSFCFRSRYRNREEGLRPPGFIMADVPKDRRPGAHWLTERVSDERIRGHAGHRSPSKR